MQTDIDRRSKRGRELAARLNRETAIKETRFFIIQDDYGERFRVWQAGTPGDVFDLIPYEGSHSLVEWWKKHPSMFVFGNPEDYAEEESA